jgi:hypothetical protein
MASHKHASKRSWNPPAAEKPRPKPQPPHAEDFASDSAEDGIVVHHASMVLPSDNFDLGDPDKLVEKMVSLWPSLHMASKLRAHVVLSFTDPSDADKAIKNGFQADDLNLEIVPGTNPNGIKIYLRGLPGKCSEQSLTYAVTNQLGRPTKVQPLFYGNTKVWTGAALVWVITNAATLPQHIHVCGHPVRISRDQYYSQPATSAAASAQADPATAANSEAAPSEAKDASAAPTTEAKDLSAAPSTTTVAKDASAAPTETLDSSAAHSTPAEVNSAPPTVAKDSSEATSTPVVPALPAADSSATGKNLSYAAKAALVKPSKAPSAAGKSSKPATGALKSAKPKDTSPSTSDIEMAVPSVNARAASPSSDNSDQKRSKVISLHD